MIFDSDGIVNTPSWAYFAKVRHDVKACKVERQVCDVRIFLGLVVRKNEPPYPLRNSEGGIRFIDLSCFVLFLTWRFTPTWRHSNRLRRWEMVYLNPKTESFSSMLVSLVERIRYCFCRVREERWTLDKWRRTRELSVVPAFFVSFKHPVFAFLRIFLCTRYYPVIVDFEKWLRYSLGRICAVLVGLSGYSLCQAVHCLRG